METIVSETSPIRVLLVEDEFLISEWVAESLSEQGFTVRTVSNAADALHHLRSTPVDVLFTDINLPGGMDGTTLARRARALLPDLSVVYASGRVNVLDPKLRVPGSAFVAKPYLPALVGRLLTDTMKGGRRASAAVTTARLSRGQETPQASGYGNRRR
jgi:two-component system, response regulator PdtaR